MRTDTLIEAYHHQPRWLKTLAAVAVASILMMGVLGPLLTWPHEDEANYLIQARWLAEGQVIYRDFFDFVTPMGQYLTALFYRVVGFTILGTRFLILAGWVLQIILLYKLAQRFMPPAWCALLVAFLWVTDTRYIVHQHHFWSGLCILAATYLACEYLESGSRKKLIFSGFIAGLAPWITQSSGVLGVMGFAAFILFTQKNNREQLPAWIQDWVLRALCVAVFCVVFLFMQGSFQDFWQDAVLWLAGGHYAGTTLLGYFSTLTSEIQTTLLPLMHPLSWPIKLFYSLRLPIIPQLLLLAGLPLMGILHSGIMLWRERSHVENKRYQQQLLVTLNGMALILATFSYSTSMHLTSNGGLALLLGFIWLAQLCRTSETKAIVIGWVFCALLQLQAVIGSLTLLSAGYWFPSFSTLPNDTLVYSYGPQQAKAYLNTIWYLNDAAQKKETVFLYSQSQTLYLASPAKNATRFRLVLPVYTSQAQQDEIVADLKENKPLYIVNDQSLKSIGRDARFARYTPEQLRLPGIERFVACHYRLIDKQDRYLIYQRNGLFDVSLCP